ncbi:MAG: hypothetical protein H8F28_00180, partial [Fibrella sp.]|nr:hypothetical protein [Armatimonadota bacterium]
RCHLKPVGDIRLPRQRPPAQCLNLFRHRVGTIRIQGVGDHGCEYMTGGTVVVLGETGRNFAAGMSGGAAFIYDTDGLFAKRINKDKNLLRESVTDAADIDRLKSLIEKHRDQTGSARAHDILENWNDSLPRFVKVISEEYKNLLSKRLATPLPMTNGNGNGSGANGNTEMLPPGNPAPAYTSPAGKA